MITAAPTIFFSETDFTGGSLTTAFPTWVCFRNGAGPARSLITKDSDQPPNRMDENELARLIHDSLAGEYSHLARDIIYDPSNQRSRISLFQSASYFQVVKIVERLGST